MIVKRCGVIVNRRGVKVKRCGVRVYVLGERLVLEEALGEVNYFTEMCSGSEKGSYLRLIDFCITQL